MGFPTILLLPATTAFSPWGSTPVAAKLHNPRWGTGYKTLMGKSCKRQPTLVGWKPSDIFGRVNFPNAASASICSGKERLN